MRITIRNWDKYNKRRDLKQPWWFALNNRLLEDTDFYEMSGDEIKAWIYILSQASKQKTDTIEVSFLHADKACNVQTSALKSTISKLLKKGILLQSVRDPNVIRTDCERNPSSTLTIHDTTIIHAQTEVRASELYNSYPRKQGKKRGLAKLKTILNNESNFEKLKLAIENYKRSLAKERTEPRFIKHFDTFLGCWEDYTDPDVGKVQAPKKPVEPYVPIPVEPHPSESSRLSHEELSKMIQGITKTI